MENPLLDLGSLNPRQREAVLHGDGPLLILAGAGTGKTRTLTCRIAHLIERGVPADRSWPWPSPTRPPTSCVSGWPG